MSKYLISDLVQLIKGVKKVSCIVINENVKKIRLVSQLVGIPTAVNSVCKCCNSSWKNIDVKNDAEFARGRAYLLYKQTQIFCKEFKNPINHQYPKILSNSANLNVPKRQLSSLKSQGEVSEKISPRSLDSSRQRRVPSSRLGRMAGFGNLFVGLGIGAASEFVKRSVGIPGSGADLSVGKSNSFLTEANIERIVNTLCRMRGAALKIGQMMSIQDNSLVSPKVQQLFERVRQSADFMPTRQMYNVINAELGHDWRQRVIDFEEKPFAAASIGQVHIATLPDGKKVAMKVQYPGVATSIETDVSNMMMVLKRFNILPRGLFAEEAVTVAKRELHWECDYYREAAYAEMFFQLLKDDDVFVVPRVIHELSASRVYTTEFYKGIVLDDCISLSQETRNWIGENILRLCLTEVFLFNTMQTDPNWSNFLYCEDTKKIILLDFGASREYNRKFVDNYLRVIKAATEKDKKGTIEYSKHLGFLTGYETKAFIDAHVEAVNVLGEAFACEEPFDFGAQSTTYRINKIIPVMLEHRLTPPPVESYSLHRKMSGCFLLCSKLKAVVNCRQLFLDIVNSYQYGLDDRQEAYIKI